MPPLTCISMWPESMGKQLTVMLLHKGYSGSWNIELQAYVEDTWFCKSNEAEKDNAGVRSRRFEWLSMPGILSLSASKGGNLVDTRLVVVSSRCVITSSDSFRTTKHWISAECKRFDRPLFTDHRDDKSLKKINTYFYYFFQDRPANPQCQYFDTWSLTNDHWPRLP